MVLLHMNNIIYNYIKLDACYDTVTRVQYNMRLH
jgi:hypothetical protein